MLPTTTDVLVVGAGPTGLALATALTQAGADCTLVDALPQGANTSRAAVVHAATLEALAPLGATEPLIDRGNRATSFTIRDHDRVLMRIDFGALPTPYPYTLMVSQATTEQILHDRLEEMGGHVHRPMRLAALEQTTDEVTAVFDDGSTTRARWVVGADGMHSVVREQAGISFRGGDYQESFLLADVVASTATPHDEVILFFSPAGMLVFAPLPDGIHRVVATLDPAPESPSVADLQRLLDERGPRRSPVKVERLTWGSRFRVHHRVAERYRAGRIVLAGDAAHVHSPAGGQGMNTGIQDGVALASALTAALAGDEAALDRYEQVRRPIAHDVVQTADRLTRLATMPPWSRPLRNTALTVAGNVPRVPQTLARQLSGLAYQS